MDFMNFMMIYGPVTISCLVLLAIIVFVIYIIAIEPSRVKEWLIWACAKAEEELGHGTGKLKLRKVYDLFIAQFPVFSKFISFETFQKWTEEALEILKDQIKNNRSIAVRVQGPDNK